jgi:hypothetical protein
MLDNNDKQTFSVNNEANRVSRYLKIIFPSSTDFYGRVTIYSLQVYGFE